MLHILLTNDDGIHSDGIYALYKELIKFAKVTVVAPDTEKSSISHAITLRSPIRISEVKKNSKFYGYAVTGNPADCVKIGLAVVLQNHKPDLIISGINHGQNDGCSVHYSGTVAGAREGALNGIASIAVSLATFNKADFTKSATITSKLIKNLDLKIIPVHTFLNINIPYLNASEIKGVKVIKQGIVPIHSKFIRKTDQYGNDYYWLGAQSVKTYRNNDDTSELQNGYVTVVPIKTDTTNYDSLQKLTSLEINNQV